MTAMSKEAHARIKINKLLDGSGWRFFDDLHGKANISLEPNVKLTQAQVDAMGIDFEAVSNGFIDFLLLDDKGFPLVVLEAKAENKNPLIGKEQARKYAKAQNCRFVILSNGNLHYLWDLAQGNPHIITRFPEPESIKGYTKFNPDPARLVTEDVPLDYIARTQMPTYDHEAGWKTEAQRPSFIQKNRLRFMRLYQQRAAQAIQMAPNGVHLPSLRPSHAPNKTESRLNRCRSSLFSLAHASCLNQTKPNELKQEPHHDQQPTTRRTATPDLANR